VSNLRARDFGNVKFTATTLAPGAWKDIQKDLFSLNEAAPGGSVAAEYNRTIAFTRTATAGIEDRVSYSRTISFTRSSVLGITNRATYERAIAFSRNYLTAVELTTFYARAFAWTERTITAILNILFWTPAKLSKKKASNYKNFFRGRR